MGSNSNVDEGKEGDEDVEEETEGGEKEGAEEEMVE